MLNFKIADQDWEFQEIHRLNYETFVDEIPQHEPNSENLLVDKYHEENDYVICLRDNHVAGMIAIRDKRPFSLDIKLQNLDDYLPESKSLCEIRLLSIKKGDRKRKVIQGLFKYLAEYCEEKNYDLAIISATKTQERLYRTLGFQPFGPAVGKKGAMYQPMFLTPRSYYNFKNSSKILNGTARYTEAPKKIVFQPGPVPIRYEVTKEFHKEPVSHRSKKFVDEFELTKKKLSELTGSRFSEILMGSGTLSNDLVAAQLSTLRESGIILSNGEFGERLIDHAKRFNLKFDIYQKEWGEKLSLDEIIKMISRSSYGWLWYVHCETSTGMFNNLGLLKKICTENNIKICADCISSIGTVPLDLHDNYLATGASGKGLASYPGLCFIFHNNIFDKGYDMPRYLDLGNYGSKSGAPYTVSSNLLYALSRSLDLIDIETNFKLAMDCSRVARSRLHKLGLDVLGNDKTCSPAIVTFKLPEYIYSIELGERLEELNVHLSYRSDYLASRNLMQYAFMGEYSRQDLDFALFQLEKSLTP